MSESHSETRVLEHPSSAPSSPCKKVTQGYCVAAGHDGLAALPLEELSVSDVAAQVLQPLGLGQYGARFSEQQIDGWALPSSFPACVPGSQHVMLI